MATNALLHKQSEISKILAGISDRINSVYGFPGIDNSAEVVKHTTANGAVGYNPIISGNGFALPSIPASWWTFGNSLACPSYYTRATCAAIIGPANNRTFRFTLNTPGRQTGLIEYTTNATSGVWASIGPSSPAWFAVTGNGSGYILSSVPVVVAPRQACSLGTLHFWVMWLAQRSWPSDIAVGAWGTTAARNFWSASYEYWRTAMPGNWSDVQQNPPFAWSGTVYTPLGAATVFGPTPPYDYLQLPSHAGRYPVNWPPFRRLREKWIGNTLNNVRNWPEGSKVRFLYAPFEGTPTNQVGNSCKTFIRTSGAWVEATGDEQPDIYEAQGVPLFADVAQIDDDDVLVRLKNALNDMQKFVMPLTMTTPKEDYVDPEDGPVNRYVWLVYERGFGDTGDGTVQRIHSRDPNVGCQASSANVIFPIFGGLPGQRKIVCGGIILFEGGWSRPRAASVQVLASSACVGGFASFNTWGAFTMPPPEQADNNSTTNSWAVVASGTYPADDSFYEIDLFDWETLRPDWLAQTSGQPKTGFSFGPAWMFGIFTYTFPAVT